MNKTWLTFVVGGLAMLLAIGSATASAVEDDAGSIIDGITPVTIATNAVTFQVDMSVRLCEGLMAIGDTVSAPGDHDGWTPGATILTDPDMDSIYVGIGHANVGDIFYKFHDGNDWENDPNRMFTVNPDSGANILPVVYFNDDDECTLTGEDVPVTFQVNMSVKMAEGSFDPAAGEWVGARGSHNGWAMGDTLLDGDVDSVYTGVSMIAEGEAIEYKYVIHNDDGSDTWEDNIPGNREYTVPTGGGSVPLVWFDDDSVVSIEVTQNILLVTDMTAMFQLGWFDPALGDQVEARGAFNGWVGGDLATDPLGILQYEWLEQNFMAFSGDNFFYKFYIAFDSLSAIVRFPTYTEDVDGHSYEHPAERGDGNRVFIHPAVSGDVGPDTYWFSDISPAGVIPETESSATVEVTFTADMTNAMNEGIFNPDADTVQLRWDDDIWRASQIVNQGSFPEIWEMTRDGMTNIYNLTLNVVGPTHYNMMYRLRIAQDGGAVVEEGGGLGVQNPYRSRFIQPNGPNDFPAQYSTPTDSWQSNAPMPGEMAPFNPSTGVELEPDLGMPVKYTLAQNYPNPFNPATRIRYQIPERANVTLKIYNVLGQEVVTLVNDVQEPGNYVALFEAQTLASGVYFYKLEAGKFVQTKKMLLMK